MHPEILHEIIAQRGREMQARAEQAALARAVSRLRRAVRRGTSQPAEADEFAIPAIPDYADGSFRTTPADDQAAGKPGRVPASRHAA
jgi:hypothetical protein